MVWGQPPYAVEPGDISNYGPQNANPGALSNGLVVKIGQAILFGFTVYSSKASGQFIQVFDAGKIPADTAVPLFSIDIAATTAKGVSFWPGRVFESGIVICNSTTGATKTIGAADTFFDVQYV